MTRFRTPFVSAGWLAFCSACMQPVIAYGLEVHPAANAGLSSSTWQMTAAQQTSFATGFADEQSVDVALVYRLPYSYTGVVFGSVAVPGGLVRGAPISNMHRYAGIDSVDPVLDSQWLDATTRGNSGTVTLGYAWRDFKLEGSAFSVYLREPAQPPSGESLRFGSKSAKLSFNPSPGWVFQLSRGSTSGLDQLVPGAQVRRTTVSATYSLPFQEGDLQATVAWGRSARKDRESTMGYLLESTLRFGGTHAVFGRMEQVGSDELIRENESLQRQMFKMNKLTVGYFHEVRASDSLRVDVGAFASRHLVPSAMAPSYGDNPTSYIMFLRLKLQ